MRQPSLSSQTHKKCSHKHYEPIIQAYQFGDQQVARLLEVRLVPSLEPSPCCICLGVYLFCLQVLCPQRKQILLFESSRRIHRSVRRQKTSGGRRRRTVSNVALTESILIAKTLNIPPPVPLPQVTTETKQPGTKTSGKEYTT